LTSGIKPPENKKKMKVTGTSQKKNTDFPHKAKRKKLPRRKRSDECCYILKLMLYTLNNFRIKSAYKL